MTGPQWAQGKRAEGSAAFGRDTVATGVCSFAAGLNNAATGRGAFVGAGGTTSPNVANGQDAFVGAGSGNVARGRASAIVAGGGAELNSNVINEGGLESFIGAGTSNSISAAQAAVVAGIYNLAAGACAFVGGGHNNAALGPDAFIGTGFSNCARGAHAAVVAGGTNTADGICAFIGGGNSHSVTAGDAGVVSGSGNSITPSGVGGFIGAGVGNTVGGAVPASRAARAILRRAATHSPPGRTLPPYTPTHSSGLMAFPSHPRPPGRFALVLQAA